MGLPKEGSLEPGAPGGGTDYTRSTWLDAMRGLGIILVVLGHAAMGSSLAVTFTGVSVFAFHMPLLIFIAGLAAWFSAPSGRVRIERRALGLLLPYLSWLVIGAVVLSGDPFGGLRHLPGALTVAALNPRTGLWFLYVLFELLLVLWALSWLPGDTRRWVAVVAIGSLLVPHLGGIEPWTGEQVSRISLSAPIALFRAGGLSHSSEILSGSLAGLNQTAGILGWRNVLWFLPFFLVGFLLGPAHSRLERSRWPALLIGTASFAMTVALIWPMAPDAWWLRSRLVGLVGSGPAEYLFVLSRFGAAAAGIVMAVGICSVAGGSLRLALTALGRISLGIYVTHGFFLTWVPGNGVVAMLVRFVVALGMSILLTSLLNQNRLTEFALLGRLPKSRSELFVGLSPLRMVAWLVLIVVCVAPWARSHGALLNIALDLLLAGALLLAFRRQRQSAV